MSSAVSDLSDACANSCRATLTKSLADDRGGPVWRCFLTPPDEMLSRSLQECIKCVRSSSSCRRCFGTGSARDIEATWQQWLTDFIEDDYPVKVIRLGFDQAGRLLEIGAHTLEDEGRVIVFHAMPARKRYTDVI